MSPQTTHPHALLTRNIIVLGKPCLGKAGFAPYHNPFHTSLDILSLLALLAFYCPPARDTTHLLNEYSALAARAVLSIHRSSCTILYFTTSFILPSASLGMCGGSYVNSRLTACTTLLIFDICAPQLLFALSSFFSEYYGSVYHYL
ncbi:hypothetical protein DEU56DRAFT_841951 [Suillus clintonianus]|uniref:uncharacterized protein n=1 Tax=Suillus clintonianus TaxID=1904413 RepID=UPI001B8763E8|nr:uncharacterized protein DEU56DRAFT_841951 [Suillus clintonianus]KAG2114412.1 hypothetical protein DEU56DRAFT_841951 [Suillus clintonianus]